MMASGTEGGQGRTAVPRWRRWEPFYESFTWPAALRMAAVAGIGMGQRVLDVGCGIGDPTLQVAVLVGPRGRVLGVDIDERLVAIARERAALLGLGHVEFRVMDITSGTLAENAYDAVLARWSLADLDDPLAVVTALRQTLVPGGRIAVTAWAPAEANPWLALPLDVVARRHALPARDAERPGPFRLSTDGALARLLIRAGFQQVDQERFPLCLSAPGFAPYWELVGELGGPLGAVLALLGPEEREALRDAVAAAVERFRTGEGLRIPAQAQLAWGRA